jgi:hypothetical protein
MNAVIIASVSAAPASVSAQTIFARLLPGLRLPSREAQLAHLSCSKGVPQTSLSFSMIVQQLLQSASDMKRQKALWCNFYPRGNLSNPTLFKVGFSLYFFFLIRILVLC